MTGESWGSGTNYDYATVASDSSGAELWVARYNGPENSTDIANAIATDSSGNVYVTGYSQGGGTNYDYATIKYATSSASIEDFPKVIKELELPQGTENALLTSINNAQKSLDKGNDGAAINQLRAFINKVEAQRGKKISDEDADMLIEYANSIIDQI